MIAQKIVLKAQWPQIVAFVLARSSVWTEQGVQKVAASDETKSILCFDLGALPMLRREGKKWIATAGAKEQVINLMIGCNRETLREALRSCWKIMLKCQQVPLKSEVS